MLSLQLRQALTLHDITKLVKDYVVKLNHLFKSYDSNARQAGSPEHRYLSWRTSLLFIVVEMARGGFVINMATPYSMKSTYSCHRNVVY